MPKWRKQIASLRIGDIMTECRHQSRNWCRRDDIFCRNDPAKRRL